MPGATSERRPWLRLGGDVLGAALLAAGAWAGLLALRKQIGLYDEGILLTGAELLLAGKVPYRDFYTNYPPGGFLLLALAFRLLGPSVLVERGLGLALHVAVAAAAGRLAGRLQGRPFGLLAAGLCFAWLAGLGAAAYGWLAALGVAFAFCARWLAAVRARDGGRFLQAGLLLGAVSWFRHDLAVYLGLALGALLLADLGLARRAGRPGTIGARAAAGVALGAVGAAAVFWLPWLGLAGPGRILSDVVFEQAGHVQPARLLPFPPLVALTRPEGLPVRLPALLVDPFPAAVVLSLAGPLLALLAVLRPAPAGVAARSELWGIGALSLAVLPQLLGRSDVVHALYAVPPALLLASLWATAPGRAGRRVAVALALALPVVLGAGALRVPVRPEAFPGLARASGVPDEAAANRRTVLAFLAEHTRPGESIYVGGTDHRWTIINEMDLYFLADRPGGTRVMQFDPGLTNRRDVQLQMAADLESSGTRVAVLSGRYVLSYEPNLSQRPGSSELDAYLHAHFSVAEVAGPYRLLVRTR